MGLWDFVDFGNWNSKFSSLNIYCTTYGITTGCYQYYTIGTYQSNIFGTNIQTVIDPSALPEFGLNKIDFGKGLLSNILIGVTGNTALTVGDNNSFTYFGNSFAVNRPKDEKYQINIKGTKKSSLINIIISIGTIGLLAGNITLRVLYGTNPSVTSTTVDKNNSVITQNNNSTPYKVITELISILESRWLGLLKSSEWVFGDVVEDLIPGLVNQLQNEVDELKNKTEDMTTQSEILTAIVGVLSNENAATSIAITNANLAITALQVKDTALEAKITTIEENVKDISIATFMVFDHLGFK